MEIARSLARSRLDEAEVLSFGPMTEEKPTLRQIFEAEEAPLLRFACGILRQRETAEDIVQEAFLRLHGHWEEVHNTRAWLYRTVRNLALNHLRDHKRETLTDEPMSFDLRLKHQGKNGWFYGGLIGLLSAGVLVTGLKKAGDKP